MKDLFNKGFEVVYLEKLNAIGILKRNLLSSEVTFDNKTIQLTCEIAPISEFITLEYIQCINEYKLGE